MTDDLCLNFIERSFACFNLETLVEVADESSLKPETLLSLSWIRDHETHADEYANASNHSILHCRTARMFREGLADEGLFFRITIIRVLGVVYRVLELRDIILGVILPLLAGVDATSVVGQIQPRSNFTRFHQALTFGPQYIPGLAAYMSYSAHAELVLLSVYIVAKLLTNLLIQDTRR